MSNDRCTLSSRRLTNVALASIALLLGVVVLDRVGAPESEAVASGRKSEPSGIPNAGAQRLKMIKALEKIEERMKRLESGLEGPLEVRVVEMPDVRISE